MGILNKIKSIFFKEEPKQKVESLTEQPIIQPKGDLVGQCILCGMAVGSDDKTRELSGSICHKRCVKKAQKAMLQGKSMQEYLQ